jgi:uncharacterized protein
MRKTGARSADHAQKAMDLQTLDTWLEHLKPAPKVDGVSMLDGYLAAIIVGPCSIPPNEWFFELLGDRGNIATAQGRRLAAIMAIAERFNTIGEVLATAPSKYAPIFQRTDDGEVFAGPWCLGFTAGMKLRWDAWEKLVNSKCIEFGLLLPILLYCADELALPLGPAPQGIDMKSYLRTAYHDIPIVIPSIRDYWMPNRVAETRQPAVKPRS